MDNRHYIDPAAFLAEAQAIAGADDWGGDGFEEAYGQFVASLNTEADLTPEGTERTRSYIRRLLVSRLKLIADRKTYPDMAEQDVSAPFLIFGLPRAGTSYLHALLASDPGTAWAAHWQAWTLSPPPYLPGADNAANMTAGEHFIRSEGWDEPELRKRHTYTSDNAVEDPFLQDPSFRMGSFPFFWNVPSYAAWFSGADLAPAYRMQKMIMQALQYKRGTHRWALKGPLHLSQLPYVFEAFPDARLIMNHRDPAKALSSVFSLYRAHRAQFGNAEEHTDPAAFTRGLLGQLSASLQSVIDLRKDPAMDRKIVDVDYLDLERNPIGQIEKIYGHFDVPLTDAARTGMGDYIAANRKGKYGGHAYSLDETGVPLEEFRETMKFYTDRFDIELEL